MVIASIVLRTPDYYVVEPHGSFYGYLACSHELFDGEHVSSFNHVHVNTNLYME
jgi:hypothetical protein